MVSKKLTLVINRENVGWFYAAIKILGAILIAATLHYVRPIA